MKKLSTIKALEYLCKKANQWGVYISYDLDPHREGGEYIR
jgi:hypothetical protein